MVGCNLWTRKANTAAQNGVFYGWRSESDCMAACLTSTSCVAFDSGPVGCVLHNNTDDLKTVYYAFGVTQFVLNRHCLPTSPLTTESLLTTSTSVHTFTGMYKKNLCLSYTIGNCHIPCSCTYFISRENNFVSTCQCHSLCLVADFLFRSISCLSLIHI